MPVPGRNRRRHVTASRVTLVVGGNLLAMTNAVGLGRDSGADLIFLGLMAVPFALFDLRERGPLLAGVALTLVGLTACALGLLPVSGVPSENVTS